MDLRWMSLDLIDDKSTMVQVMAWCSEATSHYLSQCWLRSMLPYGSVNRPQWVKCQCLFDAMTSNSCVTSYEQNVIYCYFLITISYISLRYGQIFFINTYIMYIFQAGRTIIWSNITRLLHFVLQQQNYIIDHALNSLEQGSRWTKLFTCPTSRIMHYLDVLIGYKRKENAQIHLPIW